MAARGYKFYLRVSDTFSTTTREDKERAWTLGWAFCADFSGFSRNISSEPKDFGYEDNE